MLKYTTAGESHGPGLTAIIEGIPAGTPVDEKFIERELVLRQGGYGRGGRMKIEKDVARIIGGVRFGKALGSPVALFIENLDHANWLAEMSPTGEKPKASLAVTAPRPGHADLAGGLKYDVKDLRDILERSSARETAARVAAGAIAEKLLLEFEIECFTHTVNIGGIKADVENYAIPYGKDEFWKSPLYCLDPAAEKKMIERIDKAKKDGDSLGGVFEVIVRGVPPGIGSHVSAAGKLDGRLAGALMSIQAIKGVEIGSGFDVAELEGSKIHDEIIAGEAQGVIKRPTNRAGGIEGGMSNGEQIVVRAAMKPIPTLMRPLRSIDIKTGKAVDAARERSDVCAVPAAAIVGKAVVAFEVARALLEKTGGDSLEEAKRNFEGFKKRQTEYLSEIRG
jgi:chorismate synthase